jgi:hypothetical protein
MGLKKGLLPKYSKVLIQYFDTFLKAKLFGWELVNGFPTPRVKSMFC